MGSDEPKNQPNYVAWAMVVMLVVTTINMLHTWIYSAMLNYGAREKAENLRRSQPPPPISVPSPALPVQSMASPLEHDEQFRRARDSTALTLQNQCWAAVGGDVDGQQHNSFCREYHAYVSFGIMPLRPVKTAPQP